MEALKVMQGVVQGRHEYARGWKEKRHRPVVGYLCTWVPEELIFAAGGLPVRVLGSHEPQDVVEPHIFSQFCPYSRDCLAQGLLGRYSYLDGIVYAHGCYHIRQTFDSWQRHIPTPLAYFFFMPTNVQRRGAKDQVVRELEAFKEALEKHTGREMTQEALYRAVEVYDTNRRLMRQVYELRKADIPPISGSEALTMVVASQLMDKEEHNRLLASLLEELPQRQRRPQGKLRLMVVGSELDDPALYQLLEDMGGEVVIDDNCAGTRYFWNEAGTDSSVLGAIASRYLDKPPCPVYDYAEKRRRHPHVLTLARDYRVQAVLLVQLKFCDSHEYDMPSLEAMFRQEHIPTLKLECDITIPVGQFRTRIEAFFETVELEV